MIYGFLRQTRANIFALGRTPTNIFASSLFIDYCDTRAARNSHLYLFARGQNDDKHSPFCERRRFNTFWQRDFVFLPFVISVC